MAIIFQTKDWIEIPVPPANTWTDVNLLSYGAPADVAAALFIVWKDANQYNNFGVRKKGSTDDGQRTHQHAAPGISIHKLIGGCDANRIAQVYSEFNNTKIKVYIGGWFRDSEIVMFDNLKVVDYASGHPGNTNHYNVNVGAHVPAEAQAILCNFFHRETPNTTLTVTMCPTDVSSGVKVKDNYLGFGRRTATHIIHPDASRNISMSVSAVLSSNELQIAGYITARYKKAGLLSGTLTGAGNSWNLLAGYGGGISSGFAIYHEYSGNATSKQLGIRSQGDTGSYIVRESLGTKGNGELFIVPVIGDGAEMWGVDTAGASKLLVWGSLEPEPEPEDSYSATGLPPGASINSATGIITGTLTTAGVYPVEITKTLGTGGDESRTFTWTVYERLTLVAGNLRSTQQITDGAIVQDHEVSAGNLRSTQQIAGAAVTVRLQLSCSNLRSVPQTAGGSVGTSHRISAGALAAPGTISDAAVSQTYQLETGDLSQAATVQSASIGQSHPLETGNLSQASTVQSASLGTSHPLETGNLSQAATLNSVTVTHKHAVAARAMATAQRVASGAVNTSHNLGAAGMSAGQQIEQAAVLARILLGASDLDSANAISSGAVGTGARLYPANLLTGQSISSGAIDISHRVSPRSLTSGSSVAGSAVETSHHITVGATADRPEIAAGGVLQRYTLAASPLAAAGEIESGAIDSSAVLLAGDLATGQQVSAARVQQRQSLACGDMVTTGAVLAGEVLLPFGITSVLSAENDQQPLKWDEPGYALGKFGEVQGKLFVGSEQADVTEWTDSRIDFIPRQGTMGSGYYSVHVDVVLR